MDTTIIAAAAKSIVERVFAKIDDPLRSRVLSATNQIDLPKLASRAESFSFVRTIWSRTSSVSLLDFYYPNSLTVQDEVLEISSVLQIKESALIRGTVGQGKSIFLRFLFIDALRNLDILNKIPIFVELRKLGNRPTLSTVLCDAALEIGLRMDERLLEHYLKQGALILFLDGLDEVPVDRVAQMLSDLLRVINRFPSIQILITSRPWGPYAELPLRQYDIKPLDPSDLEPFIRRISTDQNAVQQILEALRSSTSVPELAELLKTPLLLSLFALVVTSNAHTPRSRVEFYDNLFDVYYQRHDATKPGFLRAHALKIGYSNAVEAFGAFAFHARRNKYGSLGRREFDECVDWAGQNLGQTIDAEAFRLEFSQVTPLLLEDGLEISFLHKSIAEYHCARHIAGLPDLKAKLFYERVHQLDDPYSFTVELQFLYDIDNRRYIEYYELPQLLTVWRPVLEAVDAKVPDTLDAAALFLLRSFGPSFVPRVWPVGYGIRSMRSETVLRALEAAAQEHNLLREDAQRSIVVESQSHTPEGKSFSNRELLRIDAVRCFYHALILSVARRVLEQIKVYVSRINHDHLADQWLLEARKSDS